MDTSDVTPVDIDSLSTKARRRRRTTREEAAILEDFYSKNPNPNYKQKEIIAGVVNMGPRNVHFWQVHHCKKKQTLLYNRYTRFQNRRAKGGSKNRMIIKSEQQGNATKLRQPSIGIVKWSDRPQFYIYQ
ncbi:hypothetical protein INT47_004000 [Mucor saturninus]|uniref:Homeobox domain-containing protein n=1 Tax=Mucor saturninus TaxID=64648 RepID=A0A8H7R7F8_9FUNG|nr:hypothetical protein INT47_004000 [Mucor saturninus]